MPSEKPKQKVKKEEPFVPPELEGIIDPATDKPVEKGEPADKGPKKGEEDVAAAGPPPKEEKPKDGAAAAGGPASGDVAAAGPPSNQIIKENKPKPE